MRRRPLLHRRHDDQRLQRHDAGIGNPSASLSSGFDIVVSNVEGQKEGILFYG